MRLCLFALALPVAATAQLIGYAYAIEVLSPCCPVRPIERRTVAGPGFVVSALAALVSAVVAAHCPGRTGGRAGPDTFTPR